MSASSVCSNCPVQQVKLGTPRIPMPSPSASSSPRQARYVGVHSSTFPEILLLALMGDDPLLDGFCDQCADGLGEACDVLFFESPFDGEHELFGVACGGRFTVELAPLECAGSI